MFSWLIKNITSSEDSALEYNFFNSVSSSYFKRLVISWMFWNWKIIFVVLFVDEELVRSSFTGQHITRIEWIIEQYSPWYFAALFVFIGPALTAWILYAVLEWINIRSYESVKKSWHRRATIAEKYDGRTKATNKMVDYYLKEKNEDRLILTNLTNELAGLKEENKRQNELNEKLTEDIKLAKEESAQLRLRQLEDEDKMNSKNYKKSAQKLLDEINQGGNSILIIAAFRQLYDRVKKNNGKYELNNPSSEIGVLVTMGIFQKELNVNEYFVTKLGEYFNVCVAMAT